MDFSEPLVYWPELKIPATTTRPLCSTDTTDGVYRIPSINLIVLVNACLYIVTQNTQRLRKGQILSRNLELARRKGLDPRKLEEQVFVVYDSIYDARRGIGRVEGRYKALELPELARWRADADELLRTSWTLRKSDAQGDAAFVWQANERARRHSGDRDPRKVAARGRFRQIATLSDRTGRRNTPTLALQCAAADRDLVARVQSVRSIGRRMDWRGVVLEHYIDQLRSECWAIRRAAQDALTSSDIFGATRTPKSLRTRANRMGEYAVSLRDVRVRPFDRVFDHVASELEQACELLHDAASRRSAEPIDPVRSLLSRIYRSMVLVDQHWRLQEVLLVVAEHHDQKRPLAPDQVVLFSDELQAIYQALTMVDRVTAEHLDVGFQTSVLPAVSGHTLMARGELLNASGVRLREVYNHLKSACEPL